MHYYEQRWKTEVKASYMNQFNDIKKPFFNQCKENAHLCIDIENEVINFCINENKTEMNDE